MYVIREVLKCKPGKVRQMVEKFKSISTALKDMGKEPLRVHEKKTEPERRSSGPFTVAAIEEGLMRACGDGLALVIPAHQMGRDRESLEVFGVERCVTISGLQ